MTRSLCVLLLTTLALAGCTLGTLSEDELFADYQVEPDADPATQIRKALEALADELGTDDVRLLELHALRDGQVILLARHPGEHGRIYGYRFDGLWLVDGELKSTDTEQVAPRLFSPDALRLDALAAWIETARGEVDFAPASFNNLSIERDEDSGRLRVQVHFRSLDQNAVITLDDAGVRVER